MTKRYLILLGVLLSCLAGLTYRLAELQVFEKDFLRKQGNARTMRVVNVPAHRGMVLDRNNEPLAASAVVQSVWINPKEFSLENANTDEFLRLVGVNKNLIKQKLKKYVEREFIYIKRQIAPNLGEEIVNLKIPGVNLKPEYRRYYPAGEVTAHVMGFTDVDDHGQEGIELAYDKWLTGIPGKKRILRDCIGREVEYIEDIEQVRSGKNLVLSLDQRLQYLAYRELEKAVEKHQAASGSAVIVSVKTGEVLAMVNQPSFNPNMRSASKQLNYRNLAVTDSFEPGSVMKTFSMTSVLENNNKITPATKVDTNPGVYAVTGGTIRDLNNNGLINISAVLQRSSNIGISKLVLELPASTLWDTYDRLGFGAITGSGFPGESSGILSVPGKNQSFVLATMAFGYGVTVTPLQLARAYAVLGAGGIKRPITFVKDSMPQATRVMSPEVAREVMTMLSQVVASEKSQARVKGYYVAGKSGTARQLGKDGYERGRHRAVFAGLAPAINPQFSIVVTIKEPSSGQFYGNQVAAPVFSKIASGALRLFNISPDLLEYHGLQVAQNVGNHS